LVIAISGIIYSLRTHATSIYLFFLEIYLL